MCECMTRGGGWLLSSPVTALRLNRAGQFYLYVAGEHVGHVRSIAARRESPRLMCNAAVLADIGPN